MAWAGGEATREDPLNLHVHLVRDRIHRPEWLEDPKGCMRRRPAVPLAPLRKGHAGPPTGNLTLGAVLNRTFGAALLSDCAARGYC